MTTESNYQDFFDQMAAIEEAAANQLSSQLITNPQLAEELNKQLQALYAAVVAADDLAPVPPDLGVAQLAGIGPDAAATLGDTRITYGVMPYDETVNKERITAVGAGGVRVIQVRPPAGAPVHAARPVCGVQARARLRRCARAARLAREQR